MQFYINRKNILPSKRNIEAYFLLFMTTTNH